VRGAPYVHLCLPKCQCAYAQSLSDSQACRLYQCLSAIRWRHWEAAAQALTRSPSPVDDPTSHDVGGMSYCACAVFVPHYSSRPRQQSNETRPLKRVVSACRRNMSADTRSVSVTCKIEDRLYVCRRECHLSQARCKIVAWNVFRAARQESA
jgi:hypothetical protein